MSTTGRELKVLSSMTTDYVSSSVLSRRLGEAVHTTLQRLLKEGLVEGISLSGGEEDHFKLTAKGLAFAKAESKRKRANRKAAAMDAARILIVDDEADITKVLKLGLERNGLAVDAYNDPIEALASVTPQKYDLAIFDVRMPRMNGFELFREFRKVEPRTNVWFMTAFEIHLPEFRKIFVDIEPAGLLKKPFSVEDLLKQVKGLLGEKKTVMANSRDK
jgi:two-component system, OmpR family, response regulator ChvI